MHLNMSNFQFTKHDSYITSIPNLYSCKLLLRSLQKHLHPFSLLPTKINFLHIQVENRAIFKILNFQNLLYISFQLSIKHTKLHNMKNSHSFKPEKSTTNNFNSQISCENLHRTRKSLYQHQNERSNTGITN